PAMATSLAAIGLIALVGAVSYGFHGELKPGAAAGGGLPGAVGGVGGTWLLLRLSSRRLARAFAALLAAIAVRLLV
ncbi:MAG: TSUP family transporter, partial [Gaiellaceae bacterium]